MLKLPIEIIAITFIVIWLTILSGILISILNHYKRLVKVESGDLKRVLDRVLRTGEENSFSIRELKSELKRLEANNLDNIQKVGIVRFNPFNETGGDHSFSLAVLDGKDNGFVITGLHTRDRTRVYIKLVKKGKSGLVLSKEENKAISEATKK